MVVTGDIMTGNTDTRFYWSLSENIYRWDQSRARGVCLIFILWMSGFGWMCIWRD